MVENNPTWVDSEGGPLIVLPVEIAHYWRGIKPPSGVTLPAGWSWGDPNGPVCDYDRACDISDYLGILEVGPGMGLVLGDEPMATTFLRTEEGGILVRWGSGEEGTDISAVVNSAPPSIWVPTPHQLRVGRDGLVIFDSASAGEFHSEMPYKRVESDWLVVRLGQGEYRVDLADYHPDEETWMILVKLTLMARSSIRSL